MRRKRQNPELFNFSFVDILATTIGVIIFVMVLVILNSANRVSFESAKQEAEAAGAAAADLTVKIADLKEKSEKLDAGTARYKVTADAKATMTEELAELQARNAVLTKEKASLTGQSDALGAEARNLCDEVARLTSANEAASRTAAANRRSIPFRIPESRATDKKSVMFECDHGRVYHLAFENTLNGSDYIMLPLLDSRLITRKTGANGETFEQAKARDSMFRKVYSRMNKNRHYAYFIVRPDSFDLFLKLRTAMWNTGYEIYWQAFDKGESLINSSSGSAPSVL